MPQKTSKTHNLSPFFSVAKMLRRLPIRAWKIIGISKKHWICVFWASKDQNTSMILKIISNTVGLYKLYMELCGPVNGLINGLLELFTPINGATLPETNLAPENGPSQKESSLPTASFRGYVSFREGISPLDTFTWFLCPSPIIFTWVGQTSLTSKSSSALRRTVQAWKGFAMPTRDHHQDYPPSGNGSDYISHQTGSWENHRLRDFLKSANWWYVIPRTQMTLVLIGKGLVLGG